VCVGFRFALWRVRGFAGGMDSGETMRPDKRSNAGQALGGCIESRRRLASPIISLRVGAAASVWSNMQNPAPTARQVTVEEAIEELGDLISIIIRSFGPIHREHLYEQIEALAAERRSKSEHAT
jgi:hypothetical protein